MAEPVTRDEFVQLAVRVDVLEREVEGEKLVTRHMQLQLLPAAGIAAIPADKHYRNLHLPR